MNYLIDLPPVLLRLRVKYDEIGMEGKRKRATDDFQILIVKEEEKKVVGCMVKIAEDEPSPNQEKDESLEQEFHSPKTTNLTIPAAYFIKKKNYTCHITPYPTKSNML